MPSGLYFTDHGQPPGAWSVADSNYVAITDGVQSGDRVVVLAYTPVRDKQKVVEGGQAGKNVFVAHAIREGVNSAPAESGGDVGQNGLHDMHIIGNAQLVWHS